MGARLNGIDVDWRASGEGRNAILFIHGFPFNSAMWQPQLADLPAGWRGIAPDLRGFGATTEGPQEIYSMDLYAQDMVTLLDHLGIEQAVICGLSMGGYVAFRFFAQYRNRVRALVLCDTRATADSPEAQRARAKLAARVRAQGTEPVVQGMLPKLVSITTRHTQPGTVELVRAMMGEAPPETIAKALLGMGARPDSEPILRDVDVPTLIIMGAEDTIASRGDHEMLARSIRGGRLTIIESAAHLPNLEQAQAFNAALAQFLAGLPETTFSLGSPLRS